MLGEEQNIHLKSIPALNPTFMGLGFLPGTKKLEGRGGEVM